MKIRRYIFTTTIIICVIVLVVLGWEAFRPDSLPDDPPPASNSQQRTPHDAGSGIVFSQISIQDELTPQEYNDDPDRWVPSPMGPLGDSKCAYNMLYDKKRRVLERNAYGKPNDLPMLELRFRKRANGQLVPCLIATVLFRPFEAGKVVNPTLSELAGVGLDRRHNYPSMTGGLGCRVLLAPSRRPDGYSALAMGQTYYMQFRQPSFETRFKTPEKWGSKIIRIPEDVPRGKKVVMEVDVTGKEGERWRRSPGRKISLKVDGAAGQGNLLVHFQDPGRKTWFSIRLGDSRKGTFRVSEFGGELTVAPEDRSWALYYVRKIDNRELRLPRDADIVATRDNTVPFELVVPKDHLPRSVRLIWLLVEKDDLNAIAWADPRDFTDSREFTLRERVQLTSVPGRYFVAYARGTSEKPQLLGTVKVGPENSGDTLAIQGLPDDH